MQNVGIKISADDATKPAFDSVTRGLGGLQGAAGMAQSSLASLGVGLSVGAFVAFAKTVIDGVDALNDLKDATGASIENISALEDVAKRTGTSFDTVGAALVKFNMVLKDAKPGTDAAQVLKQLGLNIKELKDMDPAQALLETAKAFQNFADDGNRARAMQELFGKSTKDVAAYMKDLAEKGALVATVTTKQAEEAEKFNKELSAMGKNVMDLARDITGPLVSAFNEFIKKQREAKEAGKFGLFTSMADMERAEAARRSKNHEGSFYVGNGGRGNVNPDVVRPSLPAVPDKPDSAAKAANAELEKQRELIAELSGVQKDYQEQLTRLQVVRAKTNMGEARYVELVKELIEKQPMAKNLMKDAGDAAKELAKANLAAAEARGKYVTSLASGLADLQADTLAQQEQVDRLGLSKEAIAALDAVKLESKAVTLDLLAIKTLDKNLDEAQYNLYKQQSAELRKQAAIKVNSAAKEVAIDEAKAVADAWAKTADSINSTLTDALMRGFESGKDFARNMRDTIVNMFKTLVLRPVISAVMNPIAQGITGMLGMSGGASAASSIGGSVAGNFASSALGQLTIAGSSIAAIGSSVMTGISAGFAGTSLAGATAAYGAAGMSGVAGGLGFGSSVGSALAAIGPVGWALLAAAAVAAVVDFSGETRIGADYTADTTTGRLTRDYMVSGGELEEKRVRAAVSGAVAGINARLLLIDSSSTLTGFRAGVSTSDRDRGGVFAGGTLSGGQAFGETGLGDMYKQQKFETTSTMSPDAKTAVENFVADLNQATIQALQAAADVPAAIANMLRGVDAEALSAADASALVAAVDKVIAGVTSFKTALTSLPFEGLKALSFDAAAALIAASGGIEALGANLGSYYDNFYSEQEKAAQSATSTALAFANLGVAMPLVGEGLDEWYRSEVDRLMALDQSIPANAQALAGVLSLNGSVRTLATGAQSAADSIRGAMNGISASVDSSLFGMQYGMADSEGKYSMLDVKANGFKDQMLASTDISQIAAFGQKAIDAINQSWGLLDASQQQKTYLEFEQKLEAIDTFVQNSGADAMSVQGARDDATAAKLAAAVEVGMSKYNAMLEAAAKQLADAAIELAAASKEPAKADITVHSYPAPGVETSISEGNFA